MFIALRWNPSQSYGASPPYGITQCYLLPDTCLDPSQVVWYSMCLPQRDGRLSWPGGWLYAVCLQTVTHPSSNHLPASRPGVKPHMSLLQVRWATITLVWLNGSVVSALGIRARWPGFDSRIVPLFQVSCVSPVSQLQETGMQKGSFRRLSGYSDWMR